MNLNLCSHLARAVALCAAAFAAACVSPQQTTDQSTSPDAVESSTRSTQLVTRLGLSSTVGEVGKSFESQLVHQDNYISDAEYSVSAPPPGLTFDEQSGVLRGVPTKPGFYQLTLAVRERVDKERLWASVGDRWWTENVEVAIYTPIEN